MLGIQLNVVLFPRTGCAQDFATVNHRWLVGALNLTATQHVHIVHQTSSLIKLQCNDWKTKRRILSYDTRNTADRQFHISIKDDLFPHERRQKYKMWSTMQALYKAGLRPSWRRAAIAWKQDDTWYYIYPGEIAENLPVEYIVAFAKNPKHPPPMPSTADTSTQTDTLPKAIRMEANLLIATQQDVAAAKRRGAMKTVECCMLRRKLKAAQLKLSSMAVHTPFGTHDATNGPESDRMQVDHVHDAETQTDQAAHLIPRHGAHPVEVRMAQNAEVQTDALPNDADVVVARLAELQQQVDQAAQSQNALVASVSAALEKRFQQQAADMVAERISPLTQQIAELARERDDLLAQLARLKQKKAKK